MLVVGRDPRDARTQIMWTRRCLICSVCGAIRLLDSTTAEAKRMYVEPDYRGKGVGRAVLSRLEEAARQVGVRRLVLETGVYQDAAIALYLHAGFTQVDCWGEYASSPTSVCYEKNL